MASLAFAAIERWAWVLLFVMGLFGALFAAMLLFGGPPDSDVQALTGQSWAQLSRSDPAAAKVVLFSYEFFGLNALIFAILGSAVAAVPYRKGQRWSWFAMWTFVGVIVGSQAINLRNGVPIDMDLPITLSLALLGLFLPVRRFFGKAAAAPPHQATREPS